MKERKKNSTCFYIEFRTNKGGKKSQYREAKKRKNIYISSLMLTQMKAKKEKLKYISEFYKLFTSATKKKKKKKKKKKNHIQILIKHMKNKNKELQKK